MAMRAAFFRTFALLTAALLSACGGGGGGSASVDTGGTASASTATVGLLITDAPVGRWDEAIATITAVTLIGGPDSQYPLFTGSETLDLLKLGDFSELFAVADDVPAGSYSKIRLQVSGLVLRDLDDNGTLIEEAFTQIVGGGKIDLNPRGPVTLAPGDVVVIELDFDMEKSLKITEAGNGKLIVRPVIFVDIRTETLPDAHLTRIHGEITGIDSAAGNFRLCQTEFASEWDEDSPQDADQDDGDRRCVTANTGEDTGIFADDGQPQWFADLAVGEEVTAIGRLRPRDDEDGDFDSDDADDHYFTLDAFIVEEGPLGTFRRIRGTVASIVDGALRFDLAIAPGQGIASDTPLPVQLFAESRIFNRSGDELDLDDISVDRAALVDGVMVIGEDDFIRSPLVILGDSDEPEAATLEGEVISIDDDALTLVVNDGVMDRCVDAAGAEIFLVDDSDGFSTSRGDLDDLSAGQQVSIFGTELNGCLIANTILAEQD